jgi:2-methylcitrate dehydratase PrpD
VNTTAQLAQFVADHRFSSLPRDVVELAEWTITDTLGCCIAGYTVAEKECRWIVDLVKDMGGRAEATVFVDGYRTSAPMAALANGTMIHTVDFDDTHMGAISHFGSSLVPTVFALSERVGADGAGLVEAFVVGFEVGARVGRRMMPSHYKYWHPTATFGSLAAAAAACKLLRFDAAQTERVLGLAADQAAGLRYCVDKGDYSKSLHPGAAAMRGVMLALLVAKGANGPEGIFEYPTGFCQAFSDDPSLEKITEGLGQSYELRSNSLKAYPTILCSHSSIQALREVMKDQEVGESDIERIRLRISATAKGQGMNYDPTTTLAARLSIPYCVSMAVVDRDVALQEFKEERLADPRIRDVMRRVEIQDDPTMNQRYPETLASIAEIETKTKGTIRHEVIYPKGNVKNPLNKEEVAAKFRGLASVTLPQDQSEELLSLLFRLDELSSTKELIRLLRKGGST